MATYTKFRKTGEWAIKAEGDDLRFVSLGDWVTVTRKDGRQRRAQLGERLWAASDVAIYRIANDRTPAPADLVEVPQGVGVGAMRLPPHVDDLRDEQGATFARLLGKPDYVAAHFAHEAARRDNTAPDEDLRRTVEIPIFGV